MSRFALERLRRLSVQLPSRRSASGWYWRFRLPRGRRATKSGDGDRHRTRTRRDDGSARDGRQRSSAASLSRKGFALDETHHPHVTMLQQFVRTDDLDKVFAAANAVLVKEKPTAWTLKAFKYYYIPSPPFGLAGIVVEPTEDLHRLQDELITAVKPYTVKTGTSGGVLQRGGWPRHSKSPDRVRRPFHHNRGRQAVQSARDDRRRNGNLFEQDAGGAIPVVHVLAGRRVGLSAWHLRHGAEGTQGADACALKLRRELRCRSRGEEL